ncbi:bestrophin [Rhodovarius crocodyli]|uniref:Bestrophin n=1 Tax=Rhodovarius crocodyli TaxID=1979269 RepID=A0A437LXF6_9PROT|nr:bestrophin family protein [Rhodovarius crocodyli]RVT90081.1 bestrophin [Rhodovarius crocodyli]
MYVRSTPTLLDLLIAWRGSILPYIAGRAMVVAAVSVLAVLVAHRLPGDIGGGAVPFTLIGLSLSIFMSFRNSACYDRWWEARKLWGQLLIETRSFARQTAHLPPAPREAMLTALCGFVNGLKARLRGDDEQATVAAWLPAPAALNPTDAALREVGRHLSALAADGAISEVRHSLLEGRLTAMSGVQAGCERIKSTPLPFAYSLLLHRTAWLFCLLLPFGLAGSIGWWTPALSLIVCYTFFGLDALGDQLEDPFGREVNDLPLDAMTRLLERELLAAAGRTDLPPAIEARDHLLM